MCCSNAAWKREEVPDHKFDFINVHEFHATNCTTRLQYFWLYLLFAKSVAVYIADIYTAVALLASNRWSGSILQSSAAESSSKSASVLEVPFSIGKWVFTGCIIFSFLLLAWEARKSRAIIKSRDISYAFTNVMSQNWYALRSYDHFCFFCQIDNSKKKKDEFAFFVFFTFKGWKRLLLADAPRQVINGITLYSFGKSENWTTDLSAYFGGGILKAGIIITMLFTVIIWAGSALLLIVAALMYVPLLCYIQGNLKEYVCHKVDKRIAELMKRKNRKRLAKEAEIARKEARGDYSHLKDKKTGKLTAAPLPQPTLPKLGLSDHDLYSHANGSDAGSIRGGSIRGGAPSARFQYPPPGSAVGAGWGAAPSALARTAYPYNQSEPDSLHRVGYAESVTSVDGFAGRGAPMGMQHGGFDSSTSLVGGEGMRRAPSYKSDFGGTEEKGYYGQEKGGYYSEKGGMGDDRDYVPTLSHSNSYGNFRSQSTAPPPLPTATPIPDSYNPPSRQQLYERAARQQESEDSILAYGRGGMSESGSVINFQSSNGGYGGWEESGPRYAVAQEGSAVGGGYGGGYPYEPQSYPNQIHEETLRYPNGDPADSSNFAGRGAGGKARR